MYVVKCFDKMYDTDDFEFQKCVATLKTRTGAGIGADPKKTLKGRNWNRIPKYIILNPQHWLLLLAELYNGSRT
jgi:hypothetical protein